MVSNLLILINLYEQSSTRGMGCVYHFIDAELRLYKAYVYIHTYSVDL